jgi:hypothetical protein
MQLKPLLQQTLNEMEWEDEIEFDPERETNRVGTKYQIDGQDYLLYVETEDAPCLISCFLYAPFRIPEKRHDDACVLANYFNANTRLGRLAIEGGQIQIGQCIDVEDATPSTTMITNMINTAANVARRTAKYFGTLAFTETPVSEVIKQYDAAVAVAVAEAEGQTEDVPDSL